MTKIYDTLHEIYPELANINDISVSSEKAAHSEGSVKQKVTETIDASELKQHLKNVHKEVELGTFEDNKWVRALNKIVSTMMNDYREKGGAFVFVGATAKVGASTVSYWASRLLASFDSEQKTLYISLLEKNKSSQLDIIDELIEKKYTVQDLVDSLGEANFNHLTLNIDKTHWHAPITPRIIARIAKIAKEKYRWIVVDAPPMVEVPGIYALGSEVDGTVLVARAQTTRIPTLNAISKDLDECGANLLGVVLNRRVFPLPRFLMKFF